MNQQTVGDDSEMPELVDVPNEDGYVADDGEFADDEEALGGPHLEALRTQIFQLFGHDECFNNLCPCGECDEYKGQPLVYHKAKFDHSITVEDFSEYSLFERTDYF
ncbi:hypothetical protein ISTM_463 [Insectomime virus]|nr:hypothetical protein ISTM_463 [Insectomime virus]